MGNAEFDQDICKGCGLCALACPRGIIGFSEGLNAKGYHPAALKDGGACVGCALCARMCPDSAITVTK